MRHFTRKWQIRSDDPAIQRLAEWLVHRKHLAFRGLHRRVERVVGWRIGRMIQRIGLSSLEAAVSSAVFYALRRDDRDDRVSL